MTRPDVLPNSVHSWSSSATLALGVHVSRRTCVHSGLRRTTYVDHHNIVAVKGSIILAFTSLTYLLQDTCMRTRTRKYRYTCALVTYHLKCTCPCVHSHTFIKTHTHRYSYVYMHVIHSCMRRPSFTLHIFSAHSCLFQFMCIIQVVFLV
jgi:hypothetical protein